ncbi:site-specific DNA-methyltransferase [Flavobacterium filum]|uniref:site-specific DNA-methyltransferase n=1 Tax=Flavobacterium filum TaxID=370974 RepID=UPI0023F02081|nr:site-specific DNA-methyltransferase [Flavobacterium filum]
MAEQDFIKAGFTVVGTEANENKLLSFLKENYPSIIRDNEIDLQELKAIAGLPIDEKVNGYGLNFVGRNFARAKYAQKTEKELRLNTTLSKNIDTAQNLVLKGDNLDSLKILKNHYSNKIKCIYIDPPYNTTSDEFVYPDKFDKEEAEVLGLANLSESDFARMDFSFKSKKSHNGWLAFMYPRLLLARDLLSKDGVIFISIDDNEQANLKLLCDDVFGDENFVSNIAWRKSDNQANIGQIARVKEYILCYTKEKEILNLNKIPLTEKAKKEYGYKDERGNFRRGILLHKTRGRHFYDVTTKNGNILNGPWMVKEDDFRKLDKENKILWTSSGDEQPYSKIYLHESEGQISNDFWDTTFGSNQEASLALEVLLNQRLFDFPKSTKLIKYLLTIGSQDDSIVLDFFAGSGTTGHAVMQLNAEDGGNRKFILCQIDEPIKEDKPAYQFCIENNLPPVISSITIERLKRAGEKIEKEMEEANSKVGLFEENKKPMPLCGFKVFDSVEAPKLEIDEQKQIGIRFNITDALSRIYNMIFTVGLDEPTQVPEEVVKDCIYKIGNHHYITNSEKITSDDYSNAIKNGKVFIDGWTASLNGTLQNYKEDVKIVF